MKKYIAPEALCALLSDADILTASKTQGIIDLGYGDTDNYN